MIISTSQQPHQIVASNLGTLKLLEDTSTHEYWQQTTTMTFNFNEVFWQQ
jgi:hypothetical protein